MAVGEQSLLVFCDGVQAASAEQLLFLVPGAGGTIFLGLAPLWTLPRVAGRPTRFCTYNRPGSLFSRGETVASDAAGVQLVAEQLAGVLAHVARELPRSAKLVLAGHSYGAGVALHLLLSGSGTPVDALFLLDPAPIMPPVHAEKTARIVELFTQQVSFLERLGKTGLLRVLAAVGGLMKKMGRNLPREFLDATRATLMSPSTFGEVGADAARLNTTIPLIHAALAPTTHTDRALGAMPVRLFLAQYFTEEQADKEFEQLFDFSRTHGVYGDATTDVATILLNSCDHSFRCSVQEDALVRAVVESLDSINV